MRSINPILQMSTTGLKKCHDLPKVSQWEKGYSPPLMISFLSLWLLTEIMATLLPQSRLDTPGDTEPEKRDKLYC